MKTFSSAFRLLAAAVTGLCLSGGALASEVATPPDAGAMLPPVAAEYRSTLRVGDAPEQSTTWRFWRQADRIEREDMQNGTGEIWQRDGATTFLTRIYHGDRKGIEYRSDDLQILGASPQWRQLSLLVPPELLESLAVVEPEWRDGVPVRRHRSQAAGTTWDITFRTDLMLPVEVTRTRDGRSERLELLQATSLGDAPWQPGTIEGYEIIDYADLGDRERDPFVMRISAEEGHGHAH
jgi:hypothetical protein